MMFGEPKDTAIKILGMRPPVPGVVSPPANESTAIAQAFAANTSALARLEAAVNRLSLSPKNVAQVASGYQSPIEVRSYSLLTSNENLSVRVPPARFVQAWCDGPLEGITVRLAKPDAERIKLSIFAILSVGAVDTLYLDSDVRSGRSELKLVFSDNPLDYALGNGGELINLAELAARLGSINSYDRRGRVIFEDSFENGDLSRWAVGGAGTYTALAMAERPCSGRWHCRQTTGTVAGDRAEVMRAIAYLSANRIGVEAAVYPGGAGYVTMTLWNFDGTNYQQAYVQHVGATGELYISDPSGVVLIDTIAPSSYFMYNRIKVVFDTKTGKYRRLLFNNNEYDISQYALVVQASVLGPHTQVKLGVTTDPGLNSQADYDDVIVTVNEP